MDHDTFDFRAFTLLKSGTYGEDAMYILDRLYKHRRYWRSGKLPFYNRGNPDYEVAIQLSLLRVTTTALASRDPDPPKFVDSHITRTMKQMQHIELKAAKEKAEFEKQVSLSQVRQVN